MKRIIRLGLLAGFILTLIGIPNPIQAQESEGWAEGAAVNSAALEPPSQFLAPNDAQAIDAAYTYHWTVGSAFQPRNSNVGVSYRGAGCVNRTSSPGTPDANAFAVDLQLPQGTIVLGMRLYAYDTSANNSNVHLFSYNAIGGFTTEGSVSTSGSGGYTQFDTTFAVPYTVNHSSESLSLVWYTNDNNNTMALCGVRLYLQRVKSTETVPTMLDETLSPAQPAEGNDLATVFTRRSFISGASFQRRTSSTAYDYAGAGCLTSSTGGFFSIDVNIPRSATVSGVQLFWRDTSATNGLTVNLTSYTGNGSYDILLSYSNGSVSAGYGSVYNVLPSNYTYNPLNHALGLNLTMPADTTVAVCGVRVVYTIDIPQFDGTPIPSAVLPADAEQSSPFMTGSPEAEGFIAADTIPMIPAEFDKTKAVDSATTRFFYRFMFGNVFQPWDSTTTFANPGAGCTNLTGGTPDIATALQLPDGATLFGGYLFYYDTNATTNSALLVTDYNATGSFNQFIEQSSVGNSGYGSIFFAPNPDYKVNNLSRPIALVWNPGTADSTQRLCGVQIIYTMRISAPLFVPSVLK